MKKLIPFLFAILLIGLFPRAVQAESQGNEYKGVSDPFGDPGNYEFAEDEKADKEFFHLGRFIMIGADLGLGTFTGGLGRTTSPGFMAGLHLTYFLDKILGFEIAAHYVHQTDSIRLNGGGGADISTELIPLTAAIRYYFDVKNAPRAIAIANPYLILGTGLYLRSQNVDQSAGINLSKQGSSNAFGIQAGAGMQFLVYRRNIYLGIDARYHFVFFDDEDSTLNNTLQPGDRSGDYFTSLLSLTYNF